MDSQLKIWLVLTVILLVARQTTITLTNTQYGITRTRYLWNGRWLTWLPTAWFTLSLFLYLMK